MCFPPFCQPAHHCCGCFSLRQGAAAVLVGNCLYGLCMVVIHAILLGEVKEPPRHHHGGEDRLLRRLQETGFPGPGVQGRTGGHGEHGGGGSEGDGQPSWFLQIADLDLAWGHRLLGISDHVCLIGGLVYGIVILCVCLYTLHAVVTSGQYLAPTSRYFSVFMNVEIVILFAIAIAKLANLCSIQEEYFTHLHMECELLIFLYIERVAVIVVAFSVCTWIFSSFTYVITFGNAGVHHQLDKPEFANHLDTHEVRSQPSPYQSKLAGSAGLHQSMAPPSRHNLVGPSVHAPASSHAGSFSHYGHQSVPTSGHQPAGASFQPMGLGTGARHSPSYNVGKMPRASSSMMTSTTAHSHHENDPLIKPPVAIF